jgi:hypothetical protein
MELKHKEGDLSRLLGIGRNDLMAMRKKGEALEGRHWGRVPSARAERTWEVKWTDEGLKWLQEKEGIEQDVVAFAAEAAVEVVPKEAEVVRKYRNPRVLGCEIIDPRNGRRTAVNVLVRDSKNFVAGMMVPLRWDINRWVAAKHPRFGGKW